MVKFGRASRARPHGRRVFRERFRGAVSGAVEVVWDARWHGCGHVGSRSWARGGRSRSAAS